MTVRARRRACSLLAGGVLLAGCASAPAPAPAKGSASVAPPAAGDAVATPAGPSAGAQSLDGEIRDALRSAGVNASAIRIHVQGGVVQLSGSVHSLGEKSTARKAALSVQVVSSVSVDGLTVSPAVSPVPGPVPGPAGGR